MDAKKEVWKELENLRNEFESSIQEVIKISKDKFMKIITKYGEDVSEKELLEILEWITCSVADDDHDRYQEVLKEFYGEVAND